MKDENITFLGTGWSFPPAFSKVRKSLELVSHTEDIRQSLEILLSTRPGERITQPDYGCDLSQLLYEPLTVGLGTHIKELVRTAILYFEPRILLERVDVKPDPAQEGIVSISIDFSIRVTNTRTNFIYPFYITEGTDL